MEWFAFKLEFSIQCFSLIFCMTHFALDQPHFGLWALIYVCIVCSFLPNWHCLNACKALDEYSCLVDGQTTSHTIYKLLSAVPIGHDTLVCAFQMLILTWTIFQDYILCIWVSHVSSLSKLISIKIIIKTTRIIHNSPGP